MQEYTSRFYTLSNKTEWDNNALVAVYYKRLKDPIKDELSKEDLPTDMDKVVEKVIWIDNQLQEKRAEKKNGNSNWVPYWLTQG